MTIPQTDNIDMDTLSLENLESAYIITIGAYTRDYERDMINDLDESLYFNYDLEGEIY